MIIGWPNLSSVLPDIQVLLLIAPQSTGKRTFALEQIKRLDADWIDTFCPNQRLSRQLAREAIDFLSERSNQQRWAILRLQQEGPQNILLKTLEEPPANTKIILLAEQDPLPTVLSRAQIVLRRGPLTEEELTQIILTGLSARALTSGGVRQALEIESTESFRAQAIMAGQAICNLDRERLKRSLEGWNQECSNALAIWAAESASGVPRVLISEELGSKGVGLGLTLTLARMKDANPALAANAALHVVFESIVQARKSA